MSGVQKLVEPFQFDDNINNFIILYELSDLLSQGRQAGLPRYTCCQNALLPKRSSLDR
jgi:hypothetical protein